MYVCNCFLFIYFCETNIIIIKIIDRIVESHTLIPEGLTNLSQITRAKLATQKIRS